MVDIPLPDLSKISLETADDQRHGNHVLLGSGMASRVGDSMIRGDHDPRFGTRGLDQLPQGGVAVGQGSLVLLRMRSGQVGRVVRPVEMDHGERIPAAPELVSQGP